MRPGDRSAQKVSASREKQCALGYACHMLCRLREDSCTMRISLLSFWWIPLISSGGVRMYGGT